MNNIEFKQASDGRASFSIEENGEVIALMEVGIKAETLTVYHTEVSEAYEGQGIGMKLFNTMIDYARKHKLKIVSLCKFVSAQLKRHPEQYRDVQ